MPRECGECKLCCTLLTVKEEVITGGPGGQQKTEFFTPPGEHCQYECDKGCAIYEMRPYACRRFECLWLKNKLPIWARPDKVNVIFDVAKPKITGKKMPLLLIEGEEGAHKNPKLLRFIQSLSDGAEVIVVDRNNEMTRMEDL